MFLGQNGRFLQLENRGDARKDRFEDINYLLSKKKAVKDDLYVLQFVRFRGKRAGI